LNVCGMMLACFGVLAYNRVKASEKSRKPVNQHTPEQNGSTKQPSNLFRRRDRERVFEVGKMHSSDSDVRLLLSSS